MNKCHQNLMRSHRYNWVQLLHPARGTDQNIRRGKELLRAQYLRDASVFVPCRVIGQCGPCHQQEDQIQQELQKAGEKIHKNVFEERIRTK